MANKSLVSSLVDAQTAELTRLRAENEALRGGSTALLNACYRADAMEELPDCIDGSLLDAMNAAIWPDIWTDEQVAKLNEFQNGYGPPFTCGSGNRSDAAHAAVRSEEGGDLGQLVATRQGWICPACDYRQFSAHEHMFSGAAQNPFRQLLGETK